MLIVLSLVTFVYFVIVVFGETFLFPTIGYALICSAGLVLTIVGIIEDRRARRVVTERARESLRKEPLKPGETVYARIWSRYLAICGAHFDRIAEMQFNGEVGLHGDWREELWHLVERELLPCLSWSQAEEVDTLLRNSAKLGQVSFLEQPILDIAREKAAQARMQAGKPRPIPQEGMPCACCGRPPDAAHGTLSARAFEEWCRDVLTENGWDAQITKGSGDQGADVIATQGHRKLVIQCKRYMTPVGNAAVQQVVSARMFYGATEAVVVASHSGYTRAARELAARTEVVLLEAADLAHFASSPEHAAGTPRQLHRKRVKRDTRRSDSIQKRPAGALGASF